MICSTVLYAGQQKHHTRDYTQQLTNVICVSCVLYLQANWMILAMWVVLLVRASKMISRNIRLHLQRLKDCRKVLNTIYSYAERLRAYLIVPSSTSAYTCNGWLAAFRRVLNAICVYISSDSILSKRFPNIRYVYTSTNGLELVGGS